MRTTDDEGELNPRFSPLESTIKNLFALSGNRCAFPGCKHSIIDETGQVVAQVAHIKGVKPKAARFDENADPKRLRDADNLVVLCYAHHIATNDATVYTVAKMREMKAAHERRFGGLISGLRADVVDLTKGTVVRVPVSMSAYARHDDFDVVEEAAALNTVRDGIIAFTGVLARLTPDVRSVYSTIIDRGHEISENVFEISVTELEEVLGLDASRLGGLLGILTHHDLAHVFHDEVREGYHSAVTWVLTNRCPGGDIRDPIVSDVKHLGEAFGVPVETFIVDLDWRSLDS